MDHPTINRAKNILANKKFYRDYDAHECIRDLLNLIETQNKPSAKLKEDFLVEIAKERKLIAQKLNRKEIENPRSVLEALRQTPIVLLTEKCDLGQFSGIDQYQYKYNGLVYTFALEGTYIIEAYTENEIN